HFHGPRKRAARGPSPDRDRTGDLLNAIQALSQTELQPHAGRGREDSTCLYENVASWARVRERLPRSFPRRAKRAARGPRPTAKTRLRRTAHPHGTKRSVTPDRHPQNAARAPGRASALQREWS